VISVIIRYTRPFWQFKYVFTLTEYPAAYVVRSQIDSDNLDIRVLRPQSDSWTSPMGKRAFRFTGCKSDPAEVEYKNWIVENSPPRTRPWWNFFLEVGGWGTDALYLPTAYDDNSLPVYNTVLDLTPGTFYLMPSHDTSKLNTHYSFYMDKTRTFLISPEAEDSHVKNWWKPDKALRKLGPNFDPIRQASINLYSSYTDEDLRIVLDFITKCNKMTQKLTAQMKTKSKQSRKLNFHEGSLSFFAEIRRAELGGQIPNISSVISIPITLPESLTLLADKNATVSKFANRNKAL
jgi:hypothetical protein